MARRAAIAQGDSGVTIAMEKGHQQISPDLLAPQAGELDGLRLDDSTSSRSACRLTTGDDELQLASVPDAVFLLGVDGDVLDLNPLAEALVGYTRAEVEGRPIDSLLTQLEPAEVNTETGARAQHARFVPAASALHRSGDRIPVEVLVCPHERGSALAIVRRVDSATQAMCEDDVIQLVHDLKSPLSTISLESELLDATIDTLDQAALYRAVNRILLNVTFLDRMVQDLLDLSAIDRGRFTINRVPTELRGLIEQTVERAVSTRDRDRIGISAPQRVWIDIDDLRIERVISNFIHNALKYSPRTAQVNVELEVESDHVRISVLDNGPGITIADQAYIFDKYRRASDARGNDGSGLGLYVSKRIVEAHGGRIGVHSVKGVGSHFFFELPLAG